MIAASHSGYNAGGGTGSLFNSSVDESSINRAVERLSPQPRRVLAGLVDLGLTDGEIAEFVGASKSAITHLHANWLSSDDTSPGQS